MKTFIGKLALGLALAAAASGASAEVLTFEGIPFSNFPSNVNGYDLKNTATFAPPGYGNFAWSDNFRVLEGLNFTTRTGAPVGNGYTAGVTSGAYVATNGGAAPVSFQALTDDGLFNFNSVHMGAAWYNGLTVQVTGYRDGVQVYQTTTGPLSYSGSTLTFNWLNVDKVSFTSLNTGTVIDNQSTYNHAFVMDDLNVSPVPEPGTYALMIAGLGLIGFAARRRKQG